MLIEKSSQSSKLFYANQQIMYQRSANNKQHISLCQKQLNQAYTKNLRIKSKELSMTNQQLKEDRRKRQKNQTKYNEQQRLRSLYKIYSQQKMFKKEVKMTQKHLLYKNQQKIKQLITKSKQTRQIMPYQLNLLFKNKKIVQNIEEQSRQNQSLQFSKEQESNFFTMNRKELRKCKKRDNKYKILNFRTINLFQSLKQKKNTVRKNEDNQLMCMNPQEYIEKIVNSNTKFTESYNSTHQTTHTQTPHSKLESVANDNHLKTNKESPEKSIIFQQIKRRNKIQNNEVDQIKRKQFELKPWSTQQIVI